MKAPSIKKLQAEFPQLTPAETKLIRALAHARDSRDALDPIIRERCPQTHEYACRCYSDPYTSRMWRTTLVLHAIDVILGTCGVEPLYRKDDDRMRAPAYEYCNTGDTYATTLIYHRDADALRIGSWGHRRTG